MRYSEHSSKDLLIDLLGIRYVHAYEDVKRASMMLGQELADALLKHVGGRTAFNGERCDGITHKGHWEFCLQSNTKNQAGKRADELRCPGHCVQILQRPLPGWISSYAFLEAHGYPPEDLEKIIKRVIERVRDSLTEQKRLPV